MHPVSRIGAIVLAAGEARRFGTLKQAALIDGEPMVRMVASHVLAASFHPVIVVVGAQAARVIPCLAPLDVATVTNPDWALGMGSSLATGVRALTEHHDLPDALLVMLGDQPWVGADDLKHMRDAYAASPHRILASQHEARTGPPCIFPIALAGELMALRGKSGARALLQQHREHVTGFALPAAFRDIDTPTDLAAFLSARTHGLQ